MQAIVLANQRSRLRKRSIGRVVVIRGLRWSLRISAAMSLVLLILLTAIFLRSLVAADEWEYTCQQGGMTLDSDTGRLTANFSFGEMKYWLRPAEFVFTPAQGHFPLEAYWQADHVFGAVWQFTSLSPPAGILSLPMGYLFALFATAPGLWITLRLLRRKRIFPPIKTIPHRLLAAGPWACAILFYVVAIVTIYGDRNWVAYSNVQYDGKTWGVGRSNWEFIVWNSFTRHKTPHYRITTDRLSTGWPASTKFAALGFERHAVMAHGIEWFSAITVPAWFVLFLLAIWPTIALRRWWKNWRAYVPFPVIADRPPATGGV